MDDDTPPTENERRGSDGTPSEGRRVYDRPDASLDRVEALLVHADNKLGRFRRLVVAATCILAVLGGGLTWLGFRTVGPGARADELQAIVDRNHAERTYTDSVISFRLTRLERVVTTMAYETCMSDHKTPSEGCTKIFTDGIGQ